MLHLFLLHFLKSQQVIQILQITMIHTHTHTHINNGKTYLYFIYIYNVVVYYLILGYFSSLIRLINNYIDIGILYFIDCIDHFCTFLQHNSIEKNIILDNLQDIGAFFESEWVIQYKLAKKKWNSIMSFNFFLAPWKNNCTDTKIS